MTMDDVSWEIVPLRLADVPAVTAIENARFSEPWPEGAFRQQLQAPYTFYFALWTHRAEGKALVGYAGGMCYPPDAHLANIAMAEPWQGRGLGGLLLLTFLQEATARGATQVYLDVRRSNVTAQELYRRFDFAVIGVRPRYYADKEDALVMSRRISPHTIAAALRRQWAFVRRIASSPR